MGSCQSLDSLKSSLWCAPQLSGVGILYFHVQRVSSGLRVGQGCSLGAARWQLLFPVLGLFRATGSRWRAAVADNCDILVYWYGRKYFHFSKQIQMQALPLISSIALNKMSIVDLNYAYRFFDTFSLKSWSRLPFQLSLYWMCWFASNKQIKKKVRNLDLESRSQKTLQPAVLDGIL